jgi:hypothetical protein
MGVQLAFPVKKLIGLLVTILLRYQTNVTKLELAKTYGSPYLQSGNLLHMLGPVDQTYDEAALYCNKLHADLFHVTNETNVGMLFSSLGVQRKAVWTGIYKSKSLSTFLDITRYPPITKTLHDILDDSKLTLETFTGDQGVALQMIGQQLQYVTREKDDNAYSLTICVMDIPYPQRIRNIQNLINVKEVFLNQISTSLSAFQEMAKFIETQIDLLPLAGLTQQTESISITELSNLEAEINSWETVVDERANAFTKITTDLDGLELVVQHNYMMEDLKQMAMRCYQFAASPLSIMKAKLDGNHSVFRSGDNFIFVKTPATDIATISAPMPTHTPTPSTTVTTPTPMPTPTSSLPTVGPITTQAFTPRVKNTITPRLIFSTASTTTPTPTTIKTSNSTNWWIDEFFNTNWKWKNYAAWFLYSLYAPTFYEIFNLFISTSIILSLCVPMCKNYYLKRKRQEEYPRVRQIRSVRFQAEQQLHQRPEFLRTMIRSHSAPNTPLLARYFTSAERTNLNRPLTTQRNVHKTSKKRAPPPPYPQEFFLEDYYPTNDVPLFMTHEN